MKHSVSSPLLLLAAAMLVASAAPAAAGLINDVVTVTFYDAGAEAESDDVIVVDPDAAPDVEIAFHDGSNIGGEEGADAVMLDLEWIDVDDERIILAIQGGGDFHSTGYQTTGWDPDTYYLFSGLDWDPVPSAIDGVSVTQSGIIGVAVGSEVFFGDDWVSIYLDTLGVNQNTEVGTVTLDLTASPVSDYVIPEPASLALLGLGLAVGRVARRRRRRGR